MLWKLSLAMLRRPETFWMQLAHLWVRLPLEPSCSVIHFIGTLRYSTIIGTDISEIDMKNIREFSKQVIDLAEYR